MKIQMLDPKDINTLFNLCMKIDSENKNMLYEVNEREQYFNQQIQSFKQLLESKKSNIWIAQNSLNEFIGYLIAKGNNLNRIKHTIYIAMGVLEEYSQQGNGSKLLDTLFQWSSVNEIHRIELTVRESNYKAIKLYTKMGFEKEGIKKHALYIDSKYENEIYMAKIL